MPIGADEVVGRDLLALLPGHEVDLLALDGLEEGRVVLPALPGRDEEVALGRNVSLGGGIPWKADGKNWDL